MDHYCHFHPSSLAKWRCNKCCRFYDNACLPKANEKQQSGQCPLCQSFLVYLPSQTESQDQYESFKTLIQGSLKIEYFYILFGSLIISALSSVANINFSLKLLLCFSGVFFINLHFARKFIYLNYIQTPTLRRKSTTRSRQTDHSLEMLSPFSSAQLTAVSLILIFFPIYCFYYIHWIPGLLLIIFSSLSFPFLIIFSLHSSENEFGINLSKLFKATRPYLLKLCWQNLGLFWLTIVISEAAIKYSPDLVAISISAFFCTLALITALNLCSIVLMRSLRKLKARKEILQAPIGPSSIYDNDAINSLDTDIDQALKLGHYHKVVTLLEESLKRNGNSNLRRQQLFLLLNELKDFEKLSRYANLFLHWMQQRNKVKDASQFIYLLRKYDSGFILHDIGLMNSLAKRFLQANKYALVVWLAESTKHRFNPSEDLAGLFLCAARAFVTHYHDLEKAEEYLLFIIKSCGGFESAEAAKALLIHLQHNQKKQQELRS